MNFKNLFFIYPALFSVLAFADLRPNRPADRSHEEVKALLKNGNHVRCSMVERVELRKPNGKDSLGSNKTKNNVLFNSLKPESSSSSDFPVYTLLWESKEYSFYFFMNSQIGSIRIYDNKRGLTSETSLDISDFAKPEAYLAHAQLENREAVTVPSPRNPDEQIPAIRITDLRASCQFLDNFVP